MSNPACLQSFDARDWAKDFIATVKQHPDIVTDEGTMIGWFANALMRGHDEALSRVKMPDDAEFAKQ